MLHDPAAGPLALAARWRSDAQVLRRYGATARAQMLERMAAELEQSTAEGAAAVVGLSAAAELSGFTRGHLRRLYRNGRLVAAALDGGEPLFRVSDLPCKSGSAPADIDHPRGVEIARELIRTPTPRRPRAA
jgi:hypothetical protein